MSLTKLHASTVRLTAAGIGDVAMFRVPIPGYPRLRFGRIQGFHGKSLLSYPKEFLKAIGLPEKKLKMLPNEGSGTMRLSYVGRNNPLTVSGIPTSYSVALMTEDGLDDPRGITVDVPIINCAILKWDTEAYRSVREKRPPRLEEPFQDPRTYLDNLLKRLQPKT